MSTPIIINGAAGKMGRIAYEALHAHPSFQIVAQLGRNDDLKASISETKARIVIDLTRADCVYETSQTIIEAGAHPVIGTSGLTETQRLHLQEQCKQQGLGGLIVPNFSISMVLLMRFAEEAARLLPDVEIIEAHHPQKADAPSATAINTAERIARARKKPSTPHDNECARGAWYHGVPIHAVRIEGILAQQHVMFGSMGETLTLTHNTLDRRAYIPGIVLACERVLTLTSLCYGLEHILNQ